MKCLWQLFLNNNWYVLFLSANQKVITFDTESYVHVITPFSPLLPFLYRYEFGSALFVGWAAASLTVLGGSLLCCSCSKEDMRGQQYYRQSQPSTAREYV